MWQIRIEEDTEWNADQEHNATAKRWQQVCYKYDYKADPVYGESTGRFIVAIAPQHQSFLRRNLLELESDTYVRC